MTAKRKRTATLGIIVIYMVVSFRVFAGFMAESTDALLVAATGLVVVCALVGAVGLWGRKPWALSAYVVWSVVTVATRCLLDWRTDSSEPWKVAFGGAATALLLLGLGAVVKHELSETTASELDPGRS